MFCKNCGQKIDNHASFCKKCGELTKDTFNQLTKKHQTSTGHNWFLENIIPSKSFGYYFLKGFISGLLLLILMIALGDSRIGNHESWEYVAYGLLGYWLCITIGYIYVIVQNKRNNTNQETQKPRESNPPVLSTNYSDTSSHVILKKSSRYRKLWLWVIIVVVLTAIIYQPTSDWLTISFANPEMIRLAQLSGMNKKGELLFLRTNPQIVSDSEMLSNCPSIASGFNSNGFILQGCYDPQANRIYIRRMPQIFYNEEISTAAYEMLHVVYINLSNSGSANTLNQVIENNYNNINDTKLKSEIGMLEKTEPGQRDLELFSLLGTQYSNIGSDLMNYYSPYFTNIGVNVTYNAQTNKTFENYKTQLDQLQNTINSDDNAAKTAYSNSVSWARVGNAYQNNRNYNIYIADLNAENKAISQYNELLKTYNVLVSEYNGTQPISNLNQIQTAQ